MYMYILENSLCKQPYFITSNSESGFIDIWWVVFS